MHFTLSTIALFISTLIIICIIFYINKEKVRKNIINLFIGLLICLLIWDASLLLQSFLADTLAIKPIYFDYVAYIGVMFMPIILYILAQTYTNPKFKVKKYHLFLFVIPIISLLVLWTNDFHNLFYVTYSFYSTTTVFGPYFYIHALYTYGLILISLIILLKYSLTNSEKLSAQSFCFLMAIAIPVLVNVVGILGICQLTIYATPISFTISIFLFFLAIFKFDFLNINKIATSLIIEAITDGYLVLNSTNDIVLFNNIFLNILKLKSADIEDKNILEVKELKQLFSDDDLDITLNLIKTNKNKITIKKYLQKSDKYFSIDISPILRKNAYIGALLFFYDISEVEHDKIKIQADQDLLIEQERFASLGQMIGGISHNLKTPIFSISGGLEGLSDLVNELEESIDDKEVTSEDMHGIAKDMSTWIEKMKGHNSYMSDVITAVRGQTVAMSDLQNERFTIKELFDEVLILMQHELKKNLTTLKILNNTPSNAIIVGNINSLVQVINNLISNAIEAYAETNKEKIINLTANYSEEKKMIYILVQDFGPGLPDSIQKKVFKEMITTKGKYGTGLGLFMSYSNIKAHFKGDLTFETKPNEGTTFIISIPSK